ncbi:cysteine desulfurase [Flocculibacter collagenilyticus]|uniref:cysteine desulfurase n=1 Tax=Flocculibacter collagenilyticus TaxID=2744479 RepID=UPI0018F50825|nr:cysteine desulfurase [Flocculibacter collagenilyticus]
MNTFTPETIANSFSILDQRINEQPLVYLDNAATTQKPQCVVDAVKHYYEHNNANVHRGAHHLSDLATAQFETARETVAHFINANSSKEIIWTKGTTEAINLVAQSWGMTNLSEGDVIILSQLEHHANIVPWQLVAEKTGAIIKVVGLTQQQIFDLEEYKQLLALKPKLVAVSHVSNVLGNIQPVKEIIELAKSVNATVLIDGAQAVAHVPVDVQALDCDFYVFSGHKLYAPTGTGVLYGKAALLSAMPPYQAGGEMIEHVSFSGTRFNEIPFKFEAGTPNIAGVIGLSQALKFLTQFNRQDIINHEDHIYRYALAQLQQLAGIEIYGDTKHNVGVISFNVTDEHHSDIGVLMDQKGIALRTGHHCAMPLMAYMGVNGTVRASFSLYNTIEDVDRFIQALKEVKEFLG